LGASRHANTLAAAHGWAPVLNFALPGSKEQAYNAVTECLQCTLQCYVMDGLQLAAMMRAVGRCEKTGLTYGSVSTYSCASFSVSQPSIIQVWARRSRSECVTTKSKLKTHCKTMFLIRSRARCRTDCGGRPPRIDAQHRTASVTSPQRHAAAAVPAAAPSLDCYRHVVHRRSCRLRCTVVSNQVDQAKGVPGSTCGAPRSLTIITGGSRGEAP
jgi:hypothetical protein